MNLNISSFSSNSLKKACNARSFADAVLMFACLVGMEIFCKLPYIAL